MRSGDSSNFLHATRRGGESSNFLNRRPAAQRREFNLQIFSKRRCAVPGELKFSAGAAARRRELKFSAGAAKGAQIFSKRRCAAERSQFSLRLNLPLLESSLPGSLLMRRPFASRKHVQLPSKHKLISIQPERVYCNGLAPFWS